MSLTLSVFLDGEPRVQPDGRLALMVVFVDDAAGFKMRQEILVAPASTLEQVKAQIRTLRDRAQPADDLLKALQPGPFDVEPIIVPPPPPPDPTPQQVLDAAVDTLERYRRYESLGIIKNDDPKLVAALDAAITAYGKVL